MKKLLVTAMVAGAICLPFAQTEAHNRLQKNSSPVQIIQTEEKTTVSSQNKSLTATATARTDRALLSEETPANVYEDKSVQNSAPVKAVQGEYLMRSGDQLQIVVYGHDDLSTRQGVAYTPYVVRPDGKLAMPLIGDVNCQNRTVPEVTQEITNRLAEYIIDPQVTVNITKLGTTRVYVLGEVRLQGLYELEKSHNLIDAVAKAGGFTQKSSKRKVFVARQGMNNMVAQVNMLDLLRAGKQNANIELQEGDCVYISSNHKVSMQQIMSMAYYVASATKNIDDVNN